MLTLRGSLDSSHCPLVAIAISAPSRPSEIFHALIDTGFTGFVQLPERKGREVGLAPQAASETQYADGRIDTIPLSWARIALGAEVQEGFVHLQRGSDEAIVGVELLRTGRVKFRYRGGVAEVTPSRLRNSLSSKSFSWGMDLMASSHTRFTSGFTYGLPSLSL
jgi:predicted aspartyl protease